ncbi:MAG: Transcriptional regulator, ArsR family [Methanothrix harundinacea]|uniref:Transcriptional regulator, ArsR family n=1 Tax=Methanothrix harundinacea TaxID=301375 RepID=A0A101IIK0_9EURY|nr:MAG: Transcriptional regulator, ArsR family [Methanothrix harundinacea]
MTEAVEPELLDPCVERLAKLTGDRCKAKNAARKLQTFTESIDEAALAAEAEVFKAMSDPFRLAILSQEGELGKGAEGWKVVPLPSLRGGRNRDDEPGEAFDWGLKGS